ncbi:MAG: metallophosphoesterase [Deltaproteobacteria bacterium]|nr:metallophosphoesterase [Deltaproteobacteria bacterium]
MNGEDSGETKMRAQLELIGGMRPGDADRPPSFVHVADVHLGLGDEDSERFHDYGDALAAAVEHAVRTRVTCFLIAGDLFDRRDISAATLRLARRALEPLRKAGIPAYAIEGNHDRARPGASSSWVRYLADEKVLYTLAPEWVDGKLVLAPHDRWSNRGAIARVGGIALCGLGFLGNRAEVALAEVAAQLPAEPTVLLLHAAVAEAVALPLGSVKGEALLALRPRVVYAALGHGHYRYAWPDESGAEARAPLAWNPGSLEYVRVDDTRRPERGFYHVTLGQAPVVTFVATRKRPIVRAQVDVSALDSGEAVAVEAARAAAALVKPGGAQPIVQVVLVGRARFGRYRIGLEAVDAAVRAATQALEVRIELRLDDGAAGLAGGDDGLDLAALRREVLAELVRGAQLVPEAAEARLLGLIEGWREAGSLRGEVDGDADEVIASLHGVLHPDATDFGGTP